MAPLPVHIGQTDSVNDYNFFCWFLNLSDIIVQYSCTKDYLTQFFYFLGYPSHCNRQLQPGGRIGFSYPCLLKSRKTFEQFSLCVFLCTFIS